MIHVDYPTLLDDLRGGDRVVHRRRRHLARVERGRADGGRMAEVETGGLAQGRPGVHLPRERLRLPTPTEEDLVLAAAMAAEGVDFLAVSFVRAGRRSSRGARAVVADRAELVAKIETLPAIGDLEEIVAEADAIMVARGDLGIECPLEDVPHLQKRIIRHCVEIGVPVITATQMMESMITAPAPTRAEVSDIANAVFDGTDALMLSAETAIGARSRRVVETMARIAERAEVEASYAAVGRAARAASSGEQWTRGRRPDHDGDHPRRGPGRASMPASTRSCAARGRGRTARAMARFRPTAAADRAVARSATVRTMALSWGVEPLRVDTYSIDRRAGVVRRRDGVRRGLGRRRRDGARARRRARPAERRGHRRAAHRAGA